MSTPLKIELAAKKYPACFTAFDILYYEDHPVTDLPLTERKALLQKAVIEESARFAVSRVVENNGVAFFGLPKRGSWRASSPNERTAATISTNARRTGSSART